MPAALLVGTGDEQRRCGVVDADEGEDQPRRIVGGQLLIQHDLLGDRHAAAPLPWPVRYREACGVQFCEPCLLESGEFLVADPGLSGPPVRRDVLVTPGPHGGPELVEIGRHAYNPVRPPPPARRVNSSRVADNPSGSRRCGWL